MFYVAFSESAPGYVLESDAQSRWVAFAALVIVGQKVLVYYYVCVLEVLGDFVSSAKSLYVPPKLLRRFHTNIALQFERF